MERVIGSSPIRSTNFYYLLTMGFILFIVASVLWLPLTFINIITVIWKHSKKRGFFKVVNDYFFTMAIDIDIFANHGLRSTWNALLRKSGGYKFGAQGETISSALGKNERDSTLSKIGKGLCWILNSLDEDHCKNSIK
jgi:hypothetical protein